MADDPLTTTALLALDNEGRQIVSVHCKMTYVLLPNGTCKLADAQQPFLLDNPDLPESDVLPMKTATDLLVLAHAHAPLINTADMTASIEVGSVRRNYRVFGERKCIYRGKGNLEFTKPVPFEKIELCYENAYGGLDESYPVERPKKVIDLFNPPPNLYPRNPAGRGYVLTEKAEKLDGLVLPNIENPDHLLSPQNLIVNGPQNWWRQPLPWSCDWFDLNWYPRCTFLGGFPDGLPDDDREVPEVKLGWVEPFQNKRSQEKSIEGLIDARFANAATPSLVLPFLNGNEAIRLRGMTPNQEIVVQLPDARPKMQLRFEKRVHDLVPVPNRILISTKEMGLYIVWHAIWRTPRNLPDRLPRPGDTTAFELEGIEITCNGKPVAPAESDPIPVMAPPKLSPKKK